MYRSLAESITFPEVVMRLAGAGVERYIADLVGRQKITYGVSGETYAGSLAFDGTDVPPTLDAGAVKSAITDIQQGRIPYLTFLSRIMQAGCCHYEVFITGQKAIYFGRDGAMQVEVFLGGK